MGWAGHDGRDLKVFVIFVLIIGSQSEHCFKTHFQAGSPEVTGVFLGLQVDEFESEDSKYWVPQYWLCSEGEPGIWLVENDNSVLIVLEFSYIVSPSSYWV